VRVRIAASLKLVEPIRPLLDKTATPDDTPTLLALLDTRSKGRGVCSMKSADALADGLGKQLLSLKIEELLLEISDELYESLNPHGGPIASLLSLASEADWWLLSAIRPKAERSQ
jgi:hypothetical protein